MLLGRAVFSGRSWAFFIRIPFNWLVFLGGKKVMLWAVPVYVTSACLIGYSLLAVLRRTAENSSGTLSVTQAYCLIG